MMLAARGIFLAARRRPKLPYDAEVEYLESTGTQWIDTGYVGNSMTTEFDLLACPMSLETNKSMIGSRVSTTTRHCWAAAPFTNELQIGYADTYTNLIFPLANSDVFRLYTVISSGKIVYRAHNYATGGEVSHEYTLQSFPVTSKLLFYNGSVSPASIRVFSLSFSEAGRMGKTMDMIPVRFTNEQGVSEGAMYDRANPTVGMDPDGSPRTDGLYRNRGTSVFTIGPDKTA